MQTEVGAEKKACRELAFYTANTGFISSTTQSLKSDPGAHPEYCQAMTQKQANKQKATPPKNGNR